MCLKVVRDSCTADLAGAAMAVLGVHECHRRLGAQQEARLSLDRETWRLFTKTGEQCSIRGTSAGTEAENTEKTLTSDLKNTGSHTNLSTMLHLAFSTCLLSAPSFINLYCLMYHI